MSMKFTPAASTPMSTSPGPGAGVGTSSSWRTSGPPVACTRTAFTAPGSQVDALHPRLGVAQARRRVARDRAIDAPQLFGSESHLRGPGVLLDVAAAFRSGNRDDILALRQDPGERELRRGTLLFPRHRLHRVGERQIALEVLALKARIVAAVIVRREVLGLLEPAAQESAPQRAVGDETDPQLAAGREDLLLGVSRPQRVLGLQCGDRMRRMRLADGLGSGLGGTEEKDIPRLDQDRNRAARALDRDGGG